MRILLIVIAALLGAAFATGSIGVFGAALAGLAAYALAEIQTLRRRAESLEREVTALRRLGPVQRSAENVVGADRAAEEAEARAFEPSRTVSATHSAEIEPEPERASAEWQTPEPERAAAERQTSQPPAAEQIASQSAREHVPAQENPIVRAVREYFTGGNTLVRVGVVILFIGVAFLLRYVAEHTNVPIELRLSGVAVGGVVLLALGWRLRRKRPGYALALQGGAIGILYLTVFASLRLFSVLPPGPAFRCSFCSRRSPQRSAVLQNSLAFSLLAVGCGFLAPVLASSGQGNHVVLFSYYGVLNLAILAIAWFKAWRPLNVAGFLFTFVIGTAWGVLRYRPEHLLDHGAVPHRVLRAVRRHRGAVLAAADAGAARVCRRHHRVRRARRGVRSAVRARSRHAVRARLQRRAAPARCTSVSPGCFTEVSAIPSACSSKLSWRWASCS